MKEIILSDQKNLKEEKHNEFLRGEKPDGNKIGRYSLSDEGQNYADFKNQVNPLAGFGNVDLLLTRRFFNSMFVTPYYKGAYIFDAKDEKRNLLIAKYGLDIMGISQEYFDKRQKEIYSIALIYNIKKYAKIQ